MQELCAILAKVLGEMDYLSFQHFLSCKYSKVTEVGEYDLHNYDYETLQDVESEFYEPTISTHFQRFSGTFVETEVHPVYILGFAASGAEDGVGGMDPPEMLLKTGRQNFLSANIEYDNIHLENCVFSTVKLKGHYRYRDMETVYDQFYANIDAMLQQRSDSYEAPRVDRTKDTEKLMALFLDFSRSTKRVLSIPFDMVLKASLRESSTDRKTALLILELLTDLEITGFVPIDIPENHGPRWVFILGPRKELLNTLSRLFQECPLLRVSSMEDASKVTFPDTVEYRDPINLGSSDEDDQDSDEIGSDEEWSPEARKEYLSADIDPLPFTESFNSIDNTYDVDEDVEEISKLLLSLDTASYNHACGCGHGHEGHGHSLHDGGSTWYADDESNSLRVFDLALDEHEQRRADDEDMALMKDLDLNSFKW